MAVVQLRSVGLFSLVRCIDATTTGNASGSHTGLATNLSIDFDRDSPAPTITLSPGDVE